VPIDKRTNDFPRDSKGKIETEDYYIPCRKYGKEIAQIYHHGRNKLGVLIYGISTGRKCIYSAEDNNINIFDIFEGDEEISFKFKSDDIDFFAKQLGAMVQGKDIRPFSIKNLPQSDYTIPTDDFLEYRNIISGIPQGNKLILSKLTDDFLDKKVKKSLRKRGRTIEQDLRLNKMSRMKKEYIHMNNLWDEYLIFLRHKLKEGENKND